MTGVTGRPPHQGSRPCAKRPTRSNSRTEELDALTSDSEGGPAQRAAGWLGWLTGAVAFALSAYALYWTQFAVNTTVYRATFLATILGLIFVLYPLVRGGPGHERPARIEEWAFALIAVALLASLAVESSIFGRSPGAGALLLVVAGAFALYPVATRSPFLVRTQAIDWIFVGLTVAIAAYLVGAIEDYKTRPTRPTPEELVLGGTLILLVLEATRRTVGWILPFITALFLIYCYFGPSIPEPFDHRGFTLNRIIGQNVLTLEGIFSTPIDVAATFIILFTIYGAVLERGGAGRFFIDWASRCSARSPRPPPRPGGRGLRLPPRHRVRLGRRHHRHGRLARLADAEALRLHANVAGGMMSAAGSGPRSRPRRWAPPPSSSPST
jgi:TRAP-type uncharacterized transport system fused permease subunit